MRINSLSIVAGTSACNARCPFCISKMTPKQGICPQLEPVNWRNFTTACRLAARCGVNNVMITSKGEATLYPEQITEYLQHLDKFTFPLLELQTNGIVFWTKRNEYKKHLQQWYGLGLTTIALSIVHYLPEKNKEVYMPRADSYIDLEGVIGDLHEIGFSVRLSVMMAKGFIDSPAKVKELIAFAKKNKVEQLTVRSITAPEESEDPLAHKWTKEHILEDAQFAAIKEWIFTHGKKLMTLYYGAIVFDIDGQNICLTNCLTIHEDTENLRQLIFFPDGHLRYDWRYEGAILL